MKRIYGLAAASIVVIALTACGNDVDLSLPSGVTVPDSIDRSQVTIPPDLSVPDLSLPDLSLPDVSLPDLSLPDLSLPDVSLPDISLPTDFTVPEETIDLMISQLEQAGMKVDKACFTALMSDESLRKLVESSGGGTPSPDLIQKFLSCLSS